MGPRRTSLSRIEQYSKVLSSIEQNWAVFSNLEQSRAEIEQSRASLNTVPSFLPSFLPFCKDGAAQRPTQFLYFSFLTFPHIILRSCLFSLLDPYIVVLLLLLLSSPIVLSICCLFLSPSVNFFSPTAFQSDSFCSPPNNISICILFLPNNLSI